MQKRLVRKRVEGNRQQPVGFQHKRLEQTLHYIQSIDLDEPEEYTTQVVQLGQPDTLKRIKELSDAGYQFFCEADGHQAFRKRK